MRCRAVALRELSALTISAGHVGLLDVRGQSIFGVLAEDACSRQRSLLSNVRAPVMSMAAQAGLGFECSTFRQLSRSIFGTGDSPDHSHAEAPATPVGVEGNARRAPAFSNYIPVCGK